MVRKIITLFAFVLFSVLIFPAGSVSALDIDISNSGNFELSKTSVLRDYSGATHTCSYTSISSDYSGGTQGLKCSTTGTISDIRINFNLQIPENSVVQLYYYFEAASFSDDKIYPIQFASDSDMIILDISQPLNSNHRFSSPSGPDPGVDIQTGYFYKVTLMTKTATSQAHLIFTGSEQFGTTSVYFYPAGYYKLANTATTQQEIKDEIQSGNQAEQDRYDDAKNESDTNKNNSQDSSDNAQSDVDNSSKNLFQVLTDFVSSISGTSAGSCNITGDFGFFNVGTINLCSGASKIVPITTIVGTIMLVGLCVPAVITLLHRFSDLYNEVTN